MIEQMVLPREPRVPATFDLEKNGATMKAREMRERPYRKTRMKTMKKFERGKTPPKQSMRAMTSETPSVKTAFVMTQERMKAEEESVKGEISIKTVVNISFKNTGNSIIFRRLNVNMGPEENKLVCL